MAKDRYRSFLHDEPANIQWRHGGPPTYDAVNKLFEQGRTKVQQPPYPLTHFPSLSGICVQFVFACLQEWPEGSLEEIVQNAIKSWEMELSHKIRLQDFKTINPEKFKLFVNGMHLNMCQIYFLSIFSNVRGFDLMDR